jgi:hypothetical protein
LRKGRGWYPALDKRFLELLVETEIDLHSLSLASSHGNPPVISVDRFERNREKVRRVAQSRIGQERLEAYCDRVKEAFDAYVRGGLWDLWVEDDADEEADTRSESGMLAGHDADSDAGRMVSGTETTSAEEDEGEVSSSMAKTTIAVGRQARGRESAACRTRSKHAATL